MPGSERVTTRHRPGAPRDDQPVADVAAAVQAFERDAAEERGRDRPDRRQRHRALQPREDPLLAREQPLGAHAHQRAEVLLRDDTQAGALDRGAEVGVAGKPARAAPVRAYDGCIGGPGGVEVAGRHVVEDEQHAPRTESAREVRDRPPEVRRVDQRLDRDDRVVVRVEGDVVAATVKAACIGDALRTRVTLPDVDLHLAQGQPVVAPADAPLPVEHRPAEAAARVEHPRRGRQPVLARHCEHPVVAVLQARPQAAAIVPGLARRLQGLVHGEAGEAVAVGEPVRQLDVAREPVVVVRDAVVGDHAATSLPVGRCSATTVRRKARTWPSDSSQRG